MSKINFDLVSFKTKHLEIIDIITNKHNNNYFPFLILVSVTSSELRNTISHQEFEFKLLNSTQERFHTAFFT